MEQNTNLVQFRRVWKEIPFETERQGRPVGKWVDYIRIQGLGQDKQVVDREVRPEDKAEYRRQWDLYKAGLEQIAEGTPLEQWPAVSHGEILRLKSHGIHTVEAMRDVDDAGIATIGHGARELQKRAKYFLEEAAPKSADANARARAEEAEARIAELERENLQLRQMVAEAYEVPDDEDEAEAKPKKKQKRKATPAQLAVLEKGRKRLAEKRERDKAA